MSGRRFRVHGLLGQGGFGVVYRATLEDEGFATEVAVKLLRSEDLPPALLPRFRDEARILGMIRDRAVVRVFPPAILDGRPALIMELVDGQTAASLLKSNGGPLPVRVVLEIVGEVARALDAVYNQPGPDGEPLRLIHRDLKPANLQVTPGGAVKILDFGIARATFEGRESHTTAHLFGTPAYMAPELLSGQTTATSDIYALGCVFRRLLVGDKPVGGGKFKDAGLPRPADPVIPALLAFIDQMVAIEADDRPSARDVERLCQKMAGRVKGESLRDWAERNVHDQEPESCDLTGTFLRDTVVDVFEGLPTSPSLAPTPPAAPPVAPPPAQRWPLAVGALSGAFVVLAV
ncbi:MAG: serine/threonine protein kinase, partial [Myxococcales bacterium]|nr:serine/threonine protein kinase [Myxococcales bacterium]